MTEPPQNYRLKLYVSPTGRKPVEDFMEALEISDPDAAAYFHGVLFELLERHGPGLGMPHFKYLPPTEFCEIRWDGKDRGHHRIYCTIESNGRILLLHGVTKRWPKFARRDKQIANQRYADYRSKDYDISRRLADRRGT